MSGNTVEQGKRLTCCHPRLIRSLSVLHVKGNDVRLFCWYVTVLPFSDYSDDLLIDDSYVFGKLPFAAELE